MMVGTAMQIGSKKTLARWLIWTLIKKNIIFLSICSSKSQKLALILATSALIIVASIKVISVVVSATNIFIVVPSFKALIFKNFSLRFECMPYIYYVVWFKKNQAKTLTLSDSGNEINIMTSAYIKKLNS